MNSSKTCAYAVALVLSAAASHAWAEAADKADTLEEVIITAQKRAQICRALSWQLLCVLGMAVCAVLAAKGVGSLS